MECPNKKPLLASRGHPGGNPTHSLHYRELGSCHDGRKLIVGLGAVKQGISGSDTGMRPFTHRSPVFCVAVAPGRLKVPDALILNEPYTTVSLAREAMAASSSSVMSIRLKAWVSEVLNVGALHRRDQAGQWLQIRERLACRSW
jgi:hypothetical protein